MVASPDMHPRCSREFLMAFWIPSNRQGARRELWDDLVLIFHTLSHPGDLTRCAMGFRVAGPEQGTWGATD